jgi:peptide/nickel transport system permease protein
MRILKRFLSHWQNYIGLVLVAFFLEVAIFAPALAPPDDPDAPVYYRYPPGVRITSLRTPLPPDEDLVLGTTPGGYDIYYSLIWGVRPALRFGLMGAFVSGIFGVVLGAVSGYVGGWFNRVVLRITDAFLTFPVIAGVFLFNEILRPGYYRTIRGVIQDALFNFGPVLLALILFSWMPYTRIINANITRFRQIEFVYAAKTIGATRARIIFRHLLPNTISPAIVLVARDIGAMVMLEATFAFIGMGGTIPWSVILTASRDWIIGPGGNPLIYWWVFIPTTLTLILFGMGWNLLGDGLNDALDPRRV